MSASISSSTLEKFTTFGDLLRFLRRRAGITQMDLARAVGYSDAQISRLEQNLRMPDVPTVEALFIPALGLEEETRTIARLLDLAANVRRENAPGLGLCPYKGLKYFDEIDADLFVGREALTAKLTERILSLASEEFSKEVRFLAVVGASGSGKSSLIRAGLVPSLRWDKISADWLVRVFTPTTHPLESLSACLMEENRGNATPAMLLAQLVSDPLGLHQIAQNEMKPFRGSHLLLIVDQFEELFSLCRSEEERTVFIASLLSAAAETNGPTIVVIALRADFYACCAGYTQLREALSQHQEYIGAMTGEELCRAIEEPARRGRWEFEPGLVELLLRDIGSEPGALPLLSHALLETWQRRRGRVMTLSGYASSGGVRGAIAETAETVFVDQFSQKQQTVARRIFLRLTELGDETTTGDTRRRATFDELILKPEEEAITQSVLRALADARLITTSENAVEVAHEALIREWPTLRGWLEENREDLRLHHHLSNAVREWVTRNCEEDMLYRGVRLAQALEWASHHQDEMNVLESEFLQASQTLAEQEAKEKEARRQHELETAQKLAETERKRATEQEYAASQLRKRSMYIAGAFIIAVVMAVSAGFLGWQARIASRIAASRELAAASVGNLNSDPERSILLALEALSTSYTLQAENALHRAILTSRVVLAISASDPGLPVQVAFSPDGKQLATASMDEVVKIWDATTGKVLLTLTGHSATYSPDGRYLASVSSDGTVKIWETRSGKEFPLAGPISADQNVAFSPDGFRMATVTLGNLPRIWDIQTGKELVNFPGHTEYVSFAFFSPDGKRLLTTSDDGTARIWNAATGEELLRLGEHPSWVWSAAFSPDGNRLATISGNQVVIWDAVAGAKLFTLSGHVGTIYDVAFSPDGTRLATGSSDRRIKIWDSTSGRELLTLSGHTGSVISVAFSPDGFHLASGSDDGSVRIWDIAPIGEALIISNSAGLGGQIAFSPDGKSIAETRPGELKLWDAVSGKVLLDIREDDIGGNDIAFSLDQSMLATAGSDGKTQIWDVFSGKALKQFASHTGSVNALAFRADGDRLATASDDYKVKIWDVSTARSLFRLDFSSEVESVAFNPDGTGLALGFHNGTVKLWNLEQQKEWFTLRGHSDKVVSVAFSPNGKRLATASMDGTARVWNVETGQEQLVLQGHDDAVMAVSFSPSGRYVATASWDGSARIWDSSSGQELLVFTRDGAGLTDVAFSPDGTRLATDGEGGIFVYLLKVDELIALAHTRLTRSLSSEECQKYLHGDLSTCVAPPSPTTTPLPPPATRRVCQVTNTGGLNDNYFNALTYKGLQDARELRGWDIHALQSASTSDYKKHLQFYMRSACDLIVASGVMVDTVQTAAEAAPAQRFMMMDFAVNPLFSNVWTQDYATDQAAFLVGYVAASVTKTGKVGVFGGIDIPQVTGFMDGFALGVAYYNQKNGTNVKVIGWDAQRHEGLFAGGFCCTTDGRRMARQLLDAGADIILPVAGQSVGWGAGAEAREFGNALIIGVDTDWTITMPEFEDIILTSIEKRFDVSVVQAVKATENGTFTGGIHVGTLETGEVDIAPFNKLDMLISEKVKGDLEQIRAEIIAGRIKTQPHTED